MDLDILSKTVFECLKLCVSGGGGLQKGLEMGKPSLLHPRNLSGRMMAVTFRDSFRENVWNPPADVV